VAEPTLIEQFKDWGAWLLAGVLGIRQFWQSREQAMDARIDARILHGVNPPLMHEMLESIKCTVEKTCSQVEGLTERVTNVEARLPERRHSMIQISKNGHNEHEATE
jgi:4-hydroxy-3-methylbut-2-enyl diphosphate reductase IspH